MGINDKIKTLLHVTGAAISLLGVVVILLAVVLEIKMDGDILITFKNVDMPHKTQYWIGIPVVITGIFVMVAAAKPESLAVNVLAIFFLFFSTLVTIAVLVTEGPDARFVDIVYESQCKGRQVKPGNCDEQMMIVSLYKSLVYVSDVIFTLSNLALFEVFTYLIVNHIRTNMTAQTRNRTEELMITAI